MSELTQKQLCDQPCSIHATDHPFILNTPITAFIAMKETWMNTLRFLGVVIIFLFLSANAFGQESKEVLVNKLSGEILNLIKENLDVRERKLVNYDFSSADELFNLSDSRLELSDKDMIYHHRIEKAKKDVGVNLNAQYFLNHDPSLADDETQGVNRGTRARIGVEWKILREGFFGNRDKAKLLEEEQELESLKFQLDNNNRCLYFRYNMLIYLFNEEKTKLLEAREKQLEKQLELLYQVYFLKGILYEDVVKVKSEIEQIKVRIENNKEYNRWVESTLDMANLTKDYNVDALPVLKIDLDYLLQDGSRNVLLDSMARLEENIAYNREKGGLNDISLRLQAYQNIAFNDKITTVDRAFTSIGVGISVPTEILFNKNTKNNLANARLKERLKFNNYEELNTESEIINYYYEYNYKMKQYMEFIHKEILYQEKIRMEVVNQKNYKDIYRSLRILRYMDVLRTIQLEVLDLKRQMYSLLLKIYGKTHYDQLNHFVRPLDVSDFYERLPARRSLIVDQKVLKEFDVNFIKDYLITNGIDRVIIDDRGIDDQALLKTLRTTLRRGQIQVARNFPNSQLLSTNDEGVSQIVNSLLKDNFDGVVMDFSNQTTPEARNKTREFLIRKFDFFANRNQAREVNSTPINVKLSKGYPIEFISTLAREIDLLTLKLDGKGDLNYLKELSKRGFTVMEKLCLSIEASSFKDRIELEAFIDMVNSMYKIDHVVINGLSEFITLDTKTLIQPE